MAYLREANSPLIHDPQACYKVARRLARALGYQRRSAEGIASQPEASGSVHHSNQSAGVQPRRTARPVPAGGSPVEGPLPALERRVSGARSTSEMLELMREIGTPFEALLKK